MSKEKNSTGVRVVTRAQNPKYKLLSGPLFLPAVVEMSWEKNPNVSYQLLFSVLFLILKFKTGLFFSGSKVMNPQMPLCADYV